jgi:hypothetical protein
MVKMLIVNGAEVNEKGTHTALMHAAGWSGSEYRKYSKDAFRGGCGRNYERWLQKNSVKLCDRELFEVWHNMHDYYADRKYFLAILLEILFRKKYEYEYKND